MKTIGIVGGLGPESTVEYYRRLIASYQKRVGEKTLPSILINSVDVYRGLAFLDADQLDLLAEYLTDAVRRLAEAGADFAIISANTPHLVFEAVQARSPIPLISIVEAACAEVHRRGLRRVALLGTRFTMKAKFYPEVFGRAGMTIIVPTNAEMDYIHDKYINELLKGICLPATRDGLVKIVQRMQEQDDAEATLLAGTELPLILTAETIAGIPVLDTTRIHVDATVAHLLS